MDYLTSEERGRGNWVSKWVLIPDHMGIEVIHWRTSVIMIWNLVRWSEVWVIHKQSYLKSHDFFKFHRWLGAYVNLLAFIIIVISCSDQMLMNHDIRSKHLLSGVSPGRIRVWIWDGFDSMGMTQSINLIKKNEKLIWHHHFMGIRHQYIIDIKAALCCTVIFSSQCTLF